MRLLVDTHLLIWAALGQKMSNDAKRLLDPHRHDLAFSAASLWEMSIKHALGRKRFNIDIGELRQGYRTLGYAELPVVGDHAVFVARLAVHHGDPFDRLLVAQATLESRTLVTSDQLLAAYGDVVRLV